MVFIFGFQMAQTSVHLLQRSHSGSRIFLYILSFRVITNATKPWMQNWNHKPNVSLVKTHSSLSGKNLIAIKLMYRIFTLLISIYINFQIRLFFCVVFKQLGRVSSCRPDSVISLHLFYNWDSLKKTVFISWRYFNQ